MRLRQLWLTAFVFALIVAGYPQCARADVWTFDQRSEPQGIITSQSGTYVLGTALQTVNAPISSSGYCFAYWTVNGVRIAGLFGQSLTRADFVLTTNSTAVAWYFLPSLDSDGDGVADYLEWQHYGSLTNGPGTDSDGDGMTYADELVRGYSPFVRDELEDGGVMLRLSSSVTYRDEGARKHYEIRSDPQGIVTALGGFAVTGTVVTTVSVPVGASSGYYFGYWEVNGVRQADPSGQALSRVTLVMTNDVVAIARFFSSGDSDADGLDDWSEWYWFGNLLQDQNSDFDGDGFSISNELARGYAVQIKDEPEDGGVMLRLSASCKYREEGERKRYDIRSDPQGIVTTLGGYAFTGTVINTVSVPVGASSGYYFGYWEVNGVRQADPSGQALSRVTLVMTNDVVAVARFFSSGDSDADGLEDWREWYWFGNLFQNLNSDFDGDGFSISNELARGYAVQIKDEPEDGGVMLRLSASGKYREEDERKRYDIRSEPQGIVATQGGYAVTGTVINTVSVPMGASSGYYFGYWEVNGMRQAAPSGLALSRVTLVMTNDVVAVARFFSSGDSDADGLEDWREWYWFGNLFQNLNSDFDGDGFSISNELARGYAVQIRDEPEDGGIMMRTSSSVKIWLDYYPRSTGILIDGTQSSGFAGGGGTTGALKVDSCAAPALGDWDGDGDLDLTVAGAGGVLRVWENAGSPMVPNLVERTSNFSAMSWAWSGVSMPAIALGDWSGDGRADLAVGGSTGQVVLVASTGNFCDPQISSITCRLDSAAAGAIPALADFYRRGRCDLFLLLPDGTVNVYTNNGNAQMPFVEGNAKVDLLGTAVPAATGLAVMDTDEDGDLDVLVSDDSGRIWEFQQNSGAFALRTTVYGGTYSGFVRRLTIAAGDFDGDGDADVIGGFAEGGLIYLKNPLPKLCVTPATATVFSGQQVAFQADKNVAGPISWSFLRSRSGGSLGSTNGLYTSGTTESCVDVIQAAAASGLKGRAYVNVISAEDVARSGKAIIIAGRASSADPVWPTTCYLANYGYNTLRYRGYGRENMRYLSPVTGMDVDGDGVANDITAFSTRANVASAITNWVGNADKLFVYLVDHGGVADNEGYFRLNAAETISARELNAWLTGLQDQWGTEVTLVIDCCNSGSFLPALAYAGAAKRIVFAASGSREPTIFVAGGLVSFSEAFFSALMLGVSAGDAFVSAQSAMQAYQSACLDDNGDGIYTPGVDGAYASSVRIGASFVAGKDLPQIRSVLENQQLSGSTVATLWADDVVSSYSIARVWCQVVSPSYKPDPSNPVIDLPQLELAYNSGTRRYEAQYSGFSEVGTYKVIYYAKDIWGSVSLPRQAYVTQCGYAEKAIIVAGYSADSTKAGAVQKMSDMAYSVMLSRRLEASAVRFFGQEVEGNVGGLATLSELRDSVTSWSQGANKLTVFLIGEGNDGVGGFRMNAEESLLSGEFRGWLDDLQRSGTDVCVVMDFDESGNWLPSLSGLSGTARRLCVASCDNGQKANFLNDGVMSFSDFFLGCVFGGQDVWTAFTIARDSVKKASGRRQSAVLDSDGDGKYVAKKDQVIAKQWYLGSAFMMGADAPTIESVTPDIAFAAATNGILLWASGVADIGGVSNVFCLVTPPSLNTAIAGTADLERLELSWNEMAGRYEVVYSGFEAGGSYVFTFFALDSDGLFSLSQQTTVQVGDPYESDDDWMAAQEIEIGMPQERGFHKVGDEDWVRFYAPSGYVFTICATQLGTNSNLRLSVYFAEHPDSQPQLVGGMQSVDQFGFGTGVVEKTEFNLRGSEPLLPGYYYVCVDSAHSCKWGAGSEYRLEMSASQNSGSLIVVAVDTLTGAKPPTGAVAVIDGVRTQAFGVANSLLLDLSDGGHTVRVSAAEGYLPEEDPEMPGQTFNVDSSGYGNPRQVNAVGGSPRMAVFRFTPMVAATGFVCDRITGRAIRDAGLVFRARGGMLDGTPYSGYPNSAVYKSFWITGADGRFPKNVWLPESDWDLTVSAPGYADRVLSRAVLGCSRGRVASLGAIQLEVSATSADINTNGIPDLWELIFGLKGGSRDTDTDGDGASDLSEFLAGTDPTNRLSVLRFTSIEERPGLGRILKWSSANGRQYRVHWTTDLSVWPTNQSVYVGETNMWREPWGLRGRRVFYRIGLQADPWTGIVDRDLDGLPDDYEARLGLSADDDRDAKNDQDGDGHTAYQEFLAGTDPTNRLSVLRFTSIEERPGLGRILRWSSASGRQYRVHWTTDLSVWPTNQSVYVGGTNMWREPWGLRGRRMFYRIGLQVDPLAGIVDRDLDGLPDDYEIRFGMSADDDRDARADLDGDGLSLYQEYVAGTDPTNRLSVFRISEIAKASPTGCTLRWTSAVGRNYRVYWTDTPGHWPLGQSIAVGATNAWSDMSEPAPLVRFYRVGVELQ